MRDGRGLWTENDDDQHAALDTWYTQLPTFFECHEDGIKLSQCMRSFMLIMLSIEGNVLSAQDMCDSGMQRRDEVELNVSTPRPDI